ncbi:cysteine proteinase [Cristinia sonorae]|uniref:ubiquitinyl hydrolase 1 n=1 Tax=Cristinia sonorae TaxID=1940300 RepID=A0A8K0XJZ3_9AGAR|nr:cysteine proteinase [Cristinia sonorae]
MPGVTVLPPPPPPNFPTPSASNFSAASKSLFDLVPPEMQNGSPPANRETVADIKSSAAQQIQQLRGRGLSSNTLLRTAKEHIAKATKLENDGDLRGAYKSLTIAAQLTRLLMDSPELKQEKQMQGLKGPLNRDIALFTANEGRGLPERTHALETKLRDAEPEEVESPLKSGSSIAERLRMLQDHGFKDTSTSKRVSREIPSLPSVPTTRPNRLSIQDIPFSPTSSSLASPAIASSTSPSPHTLIPASSFRKEDTSPTSSPTSSPHMPHLSVSEFTQAFPSIDELDEIEANGSPHVTGNKPSPSPLLAPKAFPSIPLDPGPRPSSTPIPVTMDTTFISRPASPSQVPLQTPSHVPHSPVVPRKPSNLQLNHQVSRSPLIPAGSLALTSSSEKRDVPIRTLFPKVLHEHLNKPHFEILILDVRTKEQFAAEHIKADAIVCIEPFILLRDSVTDESIQDALTLAPRNQSILFSNRDKFDLIAICDEDSVSNPPAVNALIKAIYERSFAKMLKQVPLLLVGGIKAWKEEFGDAWVVRGTQDSTDTPNSLNTMINGVNGIGTATTSSASSSLNGLGISGVNSANGIVAPIASRPIVSHSRIPAETSTVPQVSLPMFSPSLSDTSSFTSGRSRSGTTSATASVEPNGYKMWIPPSNVADQMPSRPSSNDSSLSGPPPIDMSKKPLARRGALVSRPSSNSISYAPPPIPEHTRTHHVSASISNTSSIQYPSFPRHISPQVSGSSSSFSPSSPRIGGVSVPPQASINPSPLSRRRSEYIDQSQEALSGINGRPPIDYPDLPSQQILRPPPAVASHSMERQDNRPRLLQQSHVGPRPPTIPSDYPVVYWSDIRVGTSGLKNLGNTCYMNSTIQCLSATVPFARFFTDGRWRNAVNMINTEGTKGVLAQAFATILRDMWQGEVQFLSPTTFRRTLCTYASVFSGTEQHDCQEFLSILLDKLHEDLNRVLNRPDTTPTPEYEAQLEKLPIQVASEQEWQIYRMRSDSLVVDYFQGQYQSRLECMTCHHTSTTYNAFMFLQLPLSSGRSKVTLNTCLDAFVKEEVLEKGDAWSCPKCKKSRKATKKLTLSRLPPVLLIQLKRFSANGYFTDKIDTMVDFPLKGLDLTNYMPSPLPPGVGGVAPTSADDPRSQVPPYRYDLYAVTNHYGTLSGGHYTAFLASGNGWLHCDDSRVSEAKVGDIVGKPAYMLYYKRVKV